MKSFHRLLLDNLFRQKVVYSSQAKERAPSQFQKVSLTALQKLLAVALTGVTSQVNCWLTHYGWEKLTQSWVCHSKRTLVQKAEHRSVSSPVEWAQVVLEERLLFS